jgi:hypothetical protein
VTNKTPKAANGIPTGTRITVTINIPPTIMKTNPNTTPSNRPVRFKINANNFQMAMKGQNKQELNEFILYILEKKLCGVYLSGLAFRCGLQHDFSELCPDFGQQVQKVQ